MLQMFSWKKNPTAMVADDHLASNCLLTAREDTHHMWVGYTEARCHQ